MHGDLHDSMHEKKMHSDEDRIVELSFDVPDAVDMVLWIAGGGRILRKKRIAHRDLKATNILVKCEQLEASSSSTINPTRIFAKVVELGSSKINKMNFTPLCPPSNSRSSRWMASQLFGSATNSTAISFPFKVDVYSFGLFCNEILTGNFAEHDVS